MNTQKKKKSSSRQVSNQQGGQRRLTIPRPMAIPNVAITHRTKLRYSCNATAAVGITYTNLLDAILLSTSATVGYQVFDVVKIRAVEVWSYSPSGTVNINLAFIGGTLGAIGDEVQHTDVSMGIEPAYIFAVPDARSQCSTFQPTTSAAAFNLYCQSGTIIDLHLTYRSAMKADTPQQTQLGLVGAAPGAIYYRGFDGQPTASTKFNPLGTQQVI